MLPAWLRAACPGAGLGVCEGRGRPSGFAHGHSAIGRPKSGQTEGHAGPAPLRHGGADTTEPSEPSLLCARRLFSACHVPDWRPHQCVILGFTESSGQLHSAHQKI